MTLTAIFCPLPSMTNPGAVPDLSSVTAIRAAFEQRRPNRSAAEFTEEPSPEEFEAREGFARFLREAIPVVLGTTAADAPRAFSSWSAEQRAFLEELAKVPEEAHLNADSLSRSLSRLGAIDVGPEGDDRYLRRYVGLAQPTVLEAEVEGRPLWLSLRLCLMGRLEPGAWLRTTTGLDALERIDLARHATNDAYRLMRRWPLPRELTPELEREDATRLGELLLTLLEQVPEDALKSAISREEAAAVPNLTLVLLLSIAQVSAGKELTATAESLTTALSLFAHSTLGARLLRALPASRRRDLTQAIELTPHNLEGWVYLELLAPEDGQRAVVTALAGFKRAAKPAVAACFSALIQTFDEGARSQLRALVAIGSPNAKAIDAALTARGR